MKRAKDTPPTTYAALKAKHRRVREQPGFPHATTMRVHRALSWVARAEQEHSKGSATDPDAAFLFYWIAFNATYAVPMGSDDSLSERSLFERFFVRVLSKEHSAALYDALWEKYSGPIRSLLANQYVYQQFWNHQRGVPGFANWKERFARANRRALQCMAEKRTDRFLSILFSRLYVLRNQLIHGGATWNGNRNRSQVRDGALILGLVVPRLIDLMMDYPELDWGDPAFPVVEE
jgi:Apea-like HEPN